ncbi:MAG: hypothetical protein ACNS60_18375 [Candidatus Cyclobacteriaceae bacterium M2_1C_046]
MRLIFFLIISFFINSSLNAQWIERYTYHDGSRQKLKEIYHVRDTFSNILEGPYMSYYLNGNIESKGEFKNNETAGVWEFYYETGKLKMRGALKDNSNYGKWDYFYENGNKQMEGTIINRKREGPWKMYYESGELKSEGNFVDNKRSGFWKFYFEDGKLKGEITYEDNKGNYIEYYHTGEKKAEGPKSGTNHAGYWKYYYKDGKLQAEGPYNNNKKTGEWIYYFPNGQASSRGNFNDDQPSDEWKYFSETGEITSIGSFEEGNKAGVWKGFYPHGNIKSTTTYNGKEGLFIEYYENGQVKATGTLVDNVKHGLWKYYFQDGKLEGEVEFDNGKGLYQGYYSDGTLQSKGLIENDIRMGTWELYDNTGSLKGYYNIFYENDSLNFNAIQQQAENKVRPKREYGVADYGFKKSKFNYLKPGVNEFRGLIFSINPFTSLIGSFPVGIEFYMQERLGYEFIIEGIRDPFFVSNDDVHINDVYTRGYRFSLRQKFYNSDQNFGMWYFGHSIGFSNYSHYVNLLETASNDIITATASEYKIIYSLLLGYRLMSDFHGKGFTADGFISIGTGYRNFQLGDEETDKFNSLPKNQVPLDFNFGITFGYVSAVNKRR